MTKTEARESLRRIRSASRAVDRAINDGNAESVALWLEHLAGIASQLETDILDIHVGTGLRGVIAAPTAGE